jgi:hypothetical protein
LVLIVIEINGLYPTVQIADTGKNRRLVMGQHYRLPFLAPRPPPAGGGEKARCIERGYIRG